MSKERIGTIDGHAIYVDTGEDQVQILLDAIRSRIDKKKLKAGQTFMMPVDFGQPLVAEIHITDENEWKDK